MGETRVFGEGIGLMQDSLLDKFTQDILAAILDKGYPEKELKGFFGDNIFSWIHKHLCFDPMSFSNLPSALRIFLKQNFSWQVFSDIKMIDSQKDKLCKKFVFDLLDGHKIESVYMKYSNRITACLSTQVGCIWNCAFCYTGKMEFIRNLSSAEIIGQLYEMERLLRGVTHIVFMGMGEPLDNYENLSCAIRLLNHKMGHNIGIRKISVSTVGIVPKMEKLISEFPQVNLVLSLHSAIPEKREEIVPAEKRYPLSVLLKILKRYYHNTKRQVTFEYVVLDGFNNTLKDIKALVKITKGWDCKINIIPFNRIGMVSSEWKRQRMIAYTFARRLKSFGVKKVTVRNSRGWDIGGGCGQLAGRRINES